MSCTGCSSTPKPNPSVELGAQPPSSSILNRKTRKWTSLHQPLIDGMPSGGWSFNTSINDVPLEIRGTSAQDIMSKTRNYFFANKIEFDELNFWIEANIQWVSNTNVKNHLVSVEDLLATASGKAGEAPAGDGPAHPPSEWGSVAWRFLGLVLAKDRYDPAEFISVMRLVVEMLNPSVNPRIGCKECHLKASGMLNDLIHHPPMAIADARIWLTKKHNVVNARLGKPELGMSEAAAANFWD